MLCRAGISTPPHVLPFLERCLATQSADGNSKTGARDDVVKEVAYQLADAIENMMSSKRALSTMSSATAQHVACALAASSHLARSYQSQAVQQQAEAIAGTFVDQAAAQLQAASRHGTTVWQRCACNVARTLHSAELLLVRLEALQRGSACAQLRSMLLHAARHAPRLSAAESSGCMGPAWGWDVRAEPAACAADTAMQHGRDPTVYLCQQISHTLALCALGAGCAIWSAELAMHCAIMRIRHILMTGSAHTVPEHRTAEKLPYDYIVALCGAQLRLSNFTL